MKSKLMCLHSLFTYIWIFSFLSKLSGYLYSRFLSTLKFYYQNSPSWNKKENKSFSPLNNKREWIAVKPAIVIVQIISPKLKTSP